MSRAESQTVRLPRRRLEMNDRLMPTAGQKEQAAGRCMMRRRTQSIQQSLVRLPRSATLQLPKQGLLRPRTDASMRSLTHVAFFDTWTQTPRLREQRHTADSCRSCWVGSAQQKSRCGLACGLCLGGKGCARQSRGPSSGRMCGWGCRNRPRAGWSTRSRSWRWTAAATAPARRCRQGTARARSG